MFKKLFDNSGISEEIGKAICENYYAEKIQPTKHESALEKTLSLYGLKITKISNGELKWLAFSNAVDETFKAR